MFLFVFVFISFVVSPALTDNGAGRYRIFSCRRDQLQCLNQTCVTFYNECGQGEACILPEYPSHGTYIVPKVLVPHPGQIFKSLLLSVECNRRYGVVASDGSVTVNEKHEMLCVYGKWLPVIWPDCVRYCTLHPDPSVKYRCRVPGPQEFRPCGLYVPEGTTVDPQCRTPIYFTHKALNFMNCRNGSWDYIARCEADCGRVTPEGTGLVINGTAAKRGELPWHAAVYINTESIYEQICGGTLVSNNVVISAAHCFWNNVESKVSASKYAVAVGKLYRKWKSIHDKESQESEVKEIMIPERFQGTGSTLQSDLAVLILVTPFVFENHVKPACMSFSKDFDRVQLQVGNSGKVAGWGLTSASGARSDVLSVVELPYVDYNSCVREVPPSFQQFITLDKFCAGYTTGTTVCRGDSGGGLVFATPDQHTKRYYLRGVVSSAPTDSAKQCNDNHYATFTRIADYEEFIKEVMQGSASKLIFSHVHDKIRNSEADLEDVDKPVSVTSRREEVPWHVGVYEASREVPICAGSIISPRTVITSSSCVKHRESLTAALLVAAGQTFRRINDPRNIKDSGVQYSYVEGLYTPTDVADPTAAVLSLFREFVYNTHVQPVPLVYDSDFERLTLRSTKLAGWDPDTEKITYTDLPFIKSEYCNQSLSPEDAEPLNGGICTGYFGPKQRAISFQGGGLVYKEIYKGKERYYLRGVMVTAATCGDEPNSCAFNFDSYIIFTDLSPHEEFLRKFVNYIDIYHLLPTTTGPPTSSVEAAVA